ncbi:MAG: hypothetical protein UZ17_ACD001000752 [Acidobacteria bacterium OLB17]|nr:MAG: hypothetical protein UZ17_ACD001000752 [Acidobacteria bacterium OLB17]MCZ2389684.1 DUF2490 domain-containing protein [Acidobacteriota bacterium]
MKKLFLAIILFTFPSAALSQAAPDRSDTQSWNDIQLSIPLSKKVDLVTKLSLRFGDNLKKFAENRVQFGFAFKPVKGLAISPFYWQVNSRNLRTGKYSTEHQLDAAATYRIPVGKYGLTHRSTYEYRMRTSGNSWRYRALAGIDRSLPEKWLKDTKAFVTAEAFYDSKPKKWNRTRFSVGISRKLSKKLTLDLFYTRQNDGYSHPGDLNIIGTAWKLRL